MVVQVGVDERNKNKSKTVLKMRSVNGSSSKDGPPSWMKLEIPETCAASKMFPARAVDVSDRPEEEVRCFLDTHISFIDFVLD